MKRCVYAILMIAGGLIGWSLLVELSEVRDDPLPNLLEVASALVQLITSYEFWRKDVVASLSLTFRGFIGAGLLGIPIGAIIGLFPNIRTGILIYVEGLRSLPAVALIVICLAVLPTTIAREVIIAISCGCIVAISAAAGIRRAQSLHHNLALVMGLSMYQRFWWIQFPKSIESVLLGGRVIVSLSLVLAIVLEMLLGTSHGIGPILQDTNQKDSAVAAVIILAALGYLLNVSTAALEHLFVTQATEESSN